MTRGERVVPLRVLAIDPGPEQSGFVVLNNGRVELSGCEPNDAILLRIGDGLWDYDVLAIEMIASYGMAVGKDVFETCVWIGRFVQQWRNDANVRLVTRKEIKSHLCGTTKAKDTNVRQALIDLLGAPGTKKNPGATYGVTKHAWAALAVAVTATSIEPLNVEP